jgi:hypothetical protein
VVSQLIAIGGAPKLAALRLRPRAPNRRPAYSRNAVTELARSALGRRLRSLDIGIPELDKLPPRRPLQFGDGAYGGACRYL